MKNKNMEFWILKIIKIKYGHSKWPFLFLTQRSSFFLLKIYILFEFLDL